MSAVDASSVNHCGSPAALRGNASGQRRTSGAKGIHIARPSSIRIRMRELCPEGRDTSRGFIQLDFARLNQRKPDGPLPPCPVAFDNPLNRLDPVGA